MIVNGTMQMFFAPTVPLSGSLLVDEYQKYLDWRENLSPLLSRTEDATPHILCLQYVPQHYSLSYTLTM